MINDNMHIVFIKPTEISRPSVTQKISIILILMKVSRAVSFDRIF